MTAEERERIKAERRAAREAGRRGVSAVEARPSRGGESPKRAAGESLKAPEEHRLRRRKRRRRRRGRRPWRGRRPTASIPEKSGVQRGEEQAADTTEVEAARGEIPDPEELRARLGMKDNRIRELYEEITASRLAADEARASKEAGEGHIESLEREGAGLKERIRTLEEEVRGRRRRREGSERQIARLERELERKDGEVSHRDHLLERRAEQVEAAGQAGRGAGLPQGPRPPGRPAPRRRVGEGPGGEGGRDPDLQATVESLRGDLEPSGRCAGASPTPRTGCRAGIDLFNESEQRRSMSALSRTLGQPEVHVELDAGTRAAGPPHLHLAGRHLADLRLGPRSRRPGAPRIPQRRGRGPLRRGPQTPERPRRPRRARNARIVSHATGLQGRFSEPP